MAPELVVAICTAVAQLGVATAAYRLGSKVAARQDASEKRVDGIDTRVTALERRPGAGDKVPKPKAA